MPDLGTKTPYKFDASLTLTPPPEGYRPFYIDYTGRHGSRYLSKPKPLEKVHSALLAAKEANELTRHGEQLLTQIERLTLLNVGHYGQLTELGQSQMQTIAGRMLSHYPDVFTGKRLSVIASRVQRANDSAKYFLEAFAERYPHVIIHHQPEHRQTLLRFFEYSPAYLDYKESEAVTKPQLRLSNSLRSELVSKLVIKRLFTAPAAQRLQNAPTADGDISPMNAFTLNLFAVYQALLSLPSTTLSEQQIDFSHYFTQLELSWLSYVKTLKHYLQIGPATHPNGIQIKIAAPLLEDIISHADKAIADQNVDARLRFAHAETVSPLATLLEIEGTADVAESVENYTQVWDAARIVPMAANIQLIFYRSEQADKPILIKVLLNEREVHLPLSSASYPYYAWSDIRRFYQRKLALLDWYVGEDALTQLNTLY